MRRIIGTIGLSAVIGLFLAGSSSLQVLSESALMAASGSAFSCKNPALVNSNCNQCLSNGNGGSVFCLNTPQGYSLTPYTNPAMHYGPVTQARTSPCEGDAYNVLNDTACTYGNTFQIIPCGRSYPNDFVSGGAVTVCP